MNIRPYVILSAALNAVTTSAAVPLRWTVETSRVQPAVFDAVHGESIELEASLQSYGKSVAIDPQADWQIYWQTNGMADAWWSAPATASSGDPASARLTATFTPAMDPGAPAVNGFIGSPGNNYRAAFTLRFRHGPGATPNAIAKPVPVLDLANTVVINAPWPTDETIAETIENVIETKGLKAGLSEAEATNIVKGVVTKAFVEDLGVSGDAYTRAETDTMLDGKLDMNGPKPEYGISWQYNHLSIRGGLEETTSGIISSGGGGFTSVNGDYELYDPSTMESQYLSKKADRPDNCAAGNLAALTSNGDLADSGKSIDDFVTTDGLAPISNKVEQSLAYSTGVYQYMTANTNAWFAGTNYVTNAEQAALRHKFAFEDGMDLATVPCSMALWEVRDGERQKVWDQRDWTAWYWNFKAAQLSNGLARVTGDLAEDVRTNCMRRGWAKYTAVRGLDNPDPSTLWVDTPKVQLMAGHQWEKIVEVGGAGYWTISGNGIELSQQDAESTFLTIKDFEGNACLTFRKTSSYLVYCECGTDIVRNFTDGQGRAAFHLTTDAQPTAEFSTTLELDSFVEQGEDGCPADCEWTGSAGSWDCHFVLKPGITAKACFARFKVTREGENVVEHSVPIKINGGIVFEQDGTTRKIRPTISGNTVNWVVVQ